ncbi:class I SAM-dependent methyltransferase [Runella slithyformis]|uniref:Methyltransferase type 11 n=1 Tax=Runella slithyformis (strain ATCC 29530 / DSM 19594 / LMG 11500 / NCIMB 11436 / LSU 4) TaxID=761193 RepID=A0A7U3ZG69_RUNSL|nr:class I SAM-dependent methyltransferase [Runella slithyformis]AEI46632.1 Methyltransferase type 11 [Runella slithyformis DSM 19594]
MPSDYIPALKYHFLTPLYDGFIRLTMPEQKVKTRLIRQAGIQKGETLLDFGCGTATLMLLAEELHPDCTIFGLDIDSQILAVATKKVTLKNSSIQLKEFDGTTIPFPDGTFDKVLSSWVFHHLTTAQKNNAFREIYRVLKPGGELHIADWGKAENILMRFLFFVVQLADNFYTTNDNIKGKIPHLLEKEGFQTIEWKGNQSTLFGTLAFLKAVKSKFG